MAVVGFVVAATLTQIFIWSTQLQSLSMQEPSAICIARITDGDTFQLCDGDKVRLVAASGPIDAPETTFRPGRWNNKVLAEQAQQRLGELIEGGVLHCDGRDRYERRLCRVTVGGKDAGDQLVAEGLAVIRQDWR